MRDWIEGCRKKLGEPPRRLLWLKQWTLSPDAPMWAYTQNRTDLIRNHQRRGALLLGGRVVWATIVQANRMLFEPGVHDAPAIILTSQDLFFDDRLDVLAHTAHELYDLKGSVPDDPALRSFVQHITNERTSPGGIVLPASLTAGRRAFMCEMMIHRQNLPGQRLSSSMFPVLVEESTPAVTILPLRFWDDNLAEAFRGGLA